MNNKKRVALFGFGCVGQGLYEIFQQQQSLPFIITKVCVKDKTKKRALSDDTLVYDKNEVLKDDTVDIIVEAINDDAEALSITKEALAANKIVISASKKMLAENLQALTTLESQTKGALLYESSTCGSIPVLRTLQDYFNGISTDSITGILNGSSNFILSKIFNENLPYETALKEAQALGFAETDPTLDVGGYDASHKLKLLAYHGFKAHIALRQIFKFGINGITKAEIDLARSKNAKIKQVAVIRKVGEEKILPLVMPALVLENSPLFSVENENNAVLLDNRFTGKQLLQGKGAGSLPTGWAVFADLIAACSGYRYNHPELSVEREINIALDMILPVYLKCTSDEVMKKLEFKVEEDLSNTTKFRLVKGYVALNKLLEFNFSIHEQEIFVLLDFAKFMQEGGKSSEEKQKELIPALK